MKVSYNTEIFHDWNVNHEDNGVKVKVLSYDRDKRIYVQYEDGEIGDLRPHMVKMKLTPLLLEMLPYTVGGKPVSKKDAVKVIKKERKNNFLNKDCRYSITVNDYKQRIYHKQFMHFDNVIKAIASDDELIKLFTNVDCNIVIYNDRLPIAEIDEGEYFHPCSKKLTRNSRYTKHCLRTRLTKPQAYKLDKELSKHGF